MSIYMIRSKSRGQKRKFKILLGWIDQIEPFKDKKEPFKDTDKDFEHFHVPCGPWLAKPKTSGKIKTDFCKIWLEKTEELIEDGEVSEVGYKYIAF